jgi:hypothetical protein
MAKANKKSEKKLTLRDLFTQALLTPIVLKAIAVTVLTYVLIYLINFFHLDTFFVAFVAVFLAVIVMQEVQSGTRAVEHSAKELAGLALVIAILVWLITGGNLQTYTAIPILQTLVITFVAIILYLYILHPTKMDKEYVERLERQMR